MRKPDDLTAYAVDGFNGAKCKLLYSSPAWYAFQLGAYFKASGRAEPTDVRMGRGYSIRCRDLIFKIVERRDAPIAFERVS